VLHKVATNRAPAAGRARAMPAARATARRTPPNGGAAIRWQRTFGNQAVLRAAAPRPSAGGVPPLVHEVLRSPGRRLDPRAQNDLGARLGGDVSDVRVHTGADAAASATALGATAYTVGRDIVFGAETFAPDTREGRRLLAHELTHAMDREPGSAPPGTDVVLGSRHDDAEQAAANVASAGVDGRPGPAAARAGRPVGGPAVLRRAEAPPGVADADMQAQIDADVQKIIAILDQWHYSDADEGEVLALLTRWAHAGTGNERLTPLDRVLAKLIQRTTTVGLMGQTTSYYSLMLNHFDRVNEVRRLRDTYARTFQGEGAIAEVSIVQQDWMQTATEFYQPIKEGFYDALIAGLRGLQAAGLRRIRETVAGWPPVPQGLGLVVIDNVEMATDLLISFVLAIVGLVVGFGAGIAKLVWGLLQFLWGLVDYMMLWVLGHFSEARQRQFEEKCQGIIAGFKNFFPALHTLKDRWVAEWERASPDRKTLMIGELVGELEALIASFAAGGQAAKAVPRFPVTLPIPAPAFAATGVGVVSSGGAITVDLGVLGGRAVALGGPAAATAMAVSQEAKGGGPPEGAPKEPAPKEPLPSERKFTKAEWDKLSDADKRAFEDQWMKEHKVTRIEVVNDHHAWPKYLGGPEQGPLISLDERLHQLYHAGLDALLPRGKTVAYYASLSEAQKVENIMTLLRYTRDFDLDYHTHILDTLTKALKGTPYEGLPGKL